MAYIELDGISHSYNKTPVLHDVSITIQSGEMHALLGPSGCGKTTILRLIAGLIRPSAGRILLDGVNINALPPEKRSMGVVFQNYALFAHMTVEQNVGYGLKLSHTDKRKARSIVGEYLELTGLQEYASRKIQELSGGQQQRVAIARALAAKPHMLLLDEPMSNLDVSLRQKMREELRRIQRETAITTLLITHDQQEALSLSDTVSVIHQGRIEQTGSPYEVYEHPKSDYVASFIGDTNSISASLAQALGLRGHDGPTHIHLRPERFRVSRDSDSESIEGRVVDATFSGGYFEYRVEVQGEILRTVQLNDGTSPLVPGDHVFLKYT